MKALKKHALLLVLIIIISDFYSQSYVWKKGSNALNQPDVFGTMGIPAAANTPGGREAAANWKDAAGNLWLFGGWHADFNTIYNRLNDLWKYDIAANQWTFVKGDQAADQAGVYGTLGVASSANKPGARWRSVEWTDLNGNLWLFGGNGYDANGGFAGIGDLNDLWKYNTTTNQWTWMNGSSTINSAAVYGTMGIAAPGNVPGGRFGACSWVDATGNLWMYGGAGNSSSGTGYLSDLWMYTIATNQWTWVKGSDIDNQMGDYGVQGVASPTNLPGCRQAAMTWTDLNGNLWLMGGEGYGGVFAAGGRLNDLWRYNVSANQWTWVKGSNTIDQQTVPGSPGVPSPANQPGGRVGGVSWRDASGDLRFFSGLSNTASVSIDYMNDQWSYNINTNQWTWLNGYTVPLQTGVYGTQGVPSVLNIPGGRFQSSGWVDNSGNVWLFGGMGYSTTATFGDYGYLNDLWKFGACTTQSVSISSNSPGVCIGNSTTLNAVGAGSYSWSGGQTTASIATSPTINTSYTVSSTDANGCGNFASITVSVLPLPTLSVSGTNTMACAGETINLIAVGAASYTWSSGQQTSVISAEASNTVYTVAGTDANGCQSTATISQSVSLCTGIGEYSRTSVSVSPNPTHGQFVIDSSDPQTYPCITVLNAIGQVQLTLHAVKSGQPVNIDLPPGIYYLIIENTTDKNQVCKLIVD